MSGPILPTLASLSAGLTLAGLVGNIGGARGSAYRGMTRVAERGSGLSSRNINGQLARITQVTLAGPAGTVAETTPLTPEQRAVYQALSIQPPARVTAFDPS